MTAILVKYAVEIDIVGAGFDVAITKLNSYGSSVPWDQRESIVGDGSRVGNGNAGARVENSFRGCWVWVNDFVLDGRIGGVKVGTRSF